MSSRRASPWGNRDPSPWGRPPEVDDPKDELKELFESEPRPKKKDAENDDLKHWWSRWKPNRQPGGFSSSKFDQRTGGRPGSRTSNGQQRSQHHQGQERGKQEQAHTRQQQKTNDAEADETSIEALFAAGNRAVLEWTQSATDYEQFCVGDEATRDDITHALLAALTAMQQERDRAVEVVNLLVQERKKIREHMVTCYHSVRQSGNRSPPDALYHKVGLDRDCPSFVLAAARMAYRRKLHPDVHPPERKAEAERRFKEAEAVFDEIERQRG